MKNLLILDHDFHDDLEVLDLWACREFPDTFVIAIHDHSRAYDEGEIYERLYATNDSVRYMWT